MSKAIENLIQAQKNGMNIRPKVNGFPVLAEVLRLAGVTRNMWYLPSCQSVYVTKYGAVVSQGTQLVSNMIDIPDFNREALIHALRKDQAGESSFPEFLNATWEAGVVSYEVDFVKRDVTYAGALGEIYIESYPAVEV